jgi:adenylyltransferase/sulfurtransferase
VVDEIIYNEYMLRFKVEDYEFIVFEDGRTIIKGIGDVSTAKSLYAKYIGI